MQGNIFWLLVPKSQKILITKIASIWHSDAYLRISDMFSMNFSTWKKKIFFEFVCFPRFYDPNNVPHKSKNLVKNEVFHQNHQKSTKNWFFSNSFDRSLEYLLKYLGFDFWGHTTFFDKNMRFWTKKIFEKKKTKSTFFSKKNIHWTISVFALKVN